MFRPFMLDRNISVMFTFTSVGLFESPLLPGSLRVRFADGGLECWNA